jgi:hypothetical protein
MNQSSMMKMIREMMIRRDKKRRRLKREEEKKIKSSLSVFKECFLHFADFFFHFLM